MEASASSAAAVAEDPAKARRHAAMAAAADAKSPSDLTDQQAQDATDWFTSDEEEVEGFKDFELNVGQQVKKWVMFRVGALTRERINEIREQNTLTTEDSDGTTTRKVNEAATNARVAAESLLKPNLKDAKMRRVRGQDYMDPSDALVARFAHKPGLIDQIAGQAIDVSGYNDDDVREVRAGKS